MSDLTIDEMFPSRFLKAADLPRKGLTLTIDAVELEQLGDESKWILYFVEAGSKPLVLNKTNGLAISDAHGKRVAEWSGQKIHLRVEKVPFGGKRVDAIRVSSAELDDSVTHIGNSTIEVA
jgi:hypothetical protein